MNGNSGRALLFAAWRWRVVWPLCLSLFAVCSSIATAQIINLSNLTQLSFDVDAAVTPPTDWSTIDVDYAGSSSVLYFNLNYNGVWAIQNMPVLSREGLGSQTQQFAFSNLSAGGANLAGSSPISLSATLTPTLQGIPAAAASSLTFAADQEIFRSGGKPTAVGVNPAPVTQTGATAPVLMSAKHKGFPNQDCGSFECAPAAISNSLMWLKDNNPNAQWGTKSLSIGTMKTATNWEADGVYIFHNNSRPVGKRNAWWEDKNAYMTANGYPVMTTSTTNFTAILQAMKDGKDVEFECKGHTVSIVGMTDLGNGKYSIDIAHDTKQGVAGGTKVETVTWDGTKFTGSKFISGFNYAVIEMFMPIPEPSSLILLGLALVGLRGGLARRQNAA